jgi:hypothetical protein
MRRTHGMLLWLTQEVLMPRSLNPTRRAQPSLFQAPPAPPSFQKLPPDTQAKTIVLLARLLRDEADRRIQADPDRAVRDE